MRRMATFAVTIGLTVTGIGGAAPGDPAAAGPAARENAAAPGRAEAPRTSLALASAPGPGRRRGHAAGRLGSLQARTVRYHGYLIDVPAGWPVFRLDRDPARCVRYDMNAVYLGRPGADQQCPAHLAGRMDTISMQVSRQSPASAPAGFGPASGLSLSRGLRRSGQVLQDGPDHQLRAVISHPGLAVSATYGSSRALVSRIIASMRRDRAAASTAAGGTVAGGAGAGGAAARSPVIRLTALSRPARAHRSRARRGFDTCTAPSRRVMRHARRSYSVTAIYLGGPEAACGYGNLSRSWVRAVTRMGWRLLPLYVGRQAHCTGFRVRIRRGHAMREGRAAARHAIRLARALGIRRGAPLYDDMEAFRASNHICRRQVLSFLVGWTKQLHARGYRSGVYASAGSGGASLARTKRLWGHRLRRPDTLWFGLWDGRANLRGTPYLPRHRWPWRGHRIKQYRGPHRVRIAGRRLFIDSDLVNGAVYR